MNSRYNHMLSCWHMEPGQRPEFRQLQLSLEDYLISSDDYLNLNEQTRENENEEDPNLQSSQSENVILLDAL